MSTPGVALMIILSAVTAVTGCSDLYTVKAGPATAGIPFFQVHQGIATTEVRVQRWWELKATVEYEEVPDLSLLAAARTKAEAMKAGAQKDKEIERISQDEKKTEEEFRKKNPQKMTETLALYYTDQRDAAALLLRFNSKDTVKDAWGEVQKTFVNPAMAHTPPVEDGAGAEFLSVTRKKIQIVDKTPAYLNVTAPWFGTSNATVTLAPNGTLTSAQAQRDPQVAALVTGVGTVATAALTPLATFAAAKVAADSALEAAKVTAAATAATGANLVAQQLKLEPNKILSTPELRSYLSQPRRPAPHILRVDIKPTEYTRRYSCSTERDITAPGEQTAAPPVSSSWCDRKAEGVSYTVDVVSSVDKTKDDDDKAISVTGKITLPKPPEPAGK